MYVYFVTVLADLILCTCVKYQDLNAGQLKPQRPFLCFNNFHIETLRNLFKQY